MTESDNTPAYKDTSLPVEERVQDLISRMTLGEKVSQMINSSPAIERLGVPEYNWWNECLHGVARAGIATVFPQAIGLAATWNTKLMHRVAVAISDEARAKHHDAIRQDNRDIYFGLTFWTPNINIFRDPRWGRGQETYGEDPYLTTRFGVAFVKGLQGDDPKYLKLVATPKHFAVHSGPEAVRHGFDARVSARDMKQTYLPAFKACVQEAKAESIMGAYNRTNGEPCCAGPTLLQKILRDEWGFEGYVVSDCGAISDIYKHHHVVDTPEEAAALAVKNGCDLNCGDTFPALFVAVSQGLIAEEDIDRALARLFSARFRLGMFDPPDTVPYAQIPIEVNDCAEHRKLALQVARESIVLLKNENSFLPLDKNIKSIAVVGPNADDVEVLLGNYNGTPSKAFTPLEGIRNIVPQAEVRYARGCELSGDDTSGLAEAAEAAAQADVAVVVVGLSQAIEGEEGEVENAGDRADLRLPDIQRKLLETIRDTGTPMVVVLINGSALAVNWANENAAAIVEAWYTGQAAGTAIAEVLFGDYNPGGRLPVTFVKSADQLPPFEDYSMAGRTYRYMNDEPLYRFGYGLSYTSFAYDDLALSAKEIRPGETVEITVAVQNTGERAGDEVVQLYLGDVEASVPVPIRQLQGFRRITLQPGEKQTVSFELAPEQMCLIDDNGDRTIEPGIFEVSVGGGQPAPGANALAQSFEVTGETTVIE
ncbi:MAG: glycoside hydrolase family 3 C-terminal domain-containing protein [Planctomycetes bacterium]|nr:glycoside hydrolase family 3 C-terminal domain-containing protein [Planctomycetota bacterium]